MFDCILKNHDVFSIGLVEEEYDATDSVVENINKEESVFKKKHTHAHSHIYFIEVC